MDLHGDTQRLPYYEENELWRLDKEHKFRNLWGMNLNTPTPILPEEEGVS
jgi:hypothetical protein